MRSKALQCYQARFCYLVLLLATFAVLPSFASTSAQVQNIPKALEDWVPWVLEDYPQLECPYINQAKYADKNAHVCAFASELSLVVVDSGAKFSAKLQVLQDAWIALPGDQKHWPQSVTLNQKPAQVVEHKQGPALYLQAGIYELAGELLWKQAPSMIAVPELYASLNLSIDQQKIIHPKRVGQSLWLKQSSQENEQSDSVSLTVKRLIEDASYLTLTTLIELDVSGKIREQKLGLLLPEDFILGDISGPLPAFVDATGTLVATLKPGSWELSVKAYALSDSLNWQRPKQTELWPEQEVWAFSGAESFRSGKITGASMTDAKIAELPPQWQHLPSYLVMPGEGLEYQVAHRGKPLHLENQLRLERDLWLSFDGEELSFSDHLTGTMIEGWRLSMFSPYKLKAAEDQDGAVLITRLADQERGIENRYPRLDIQARGSVPADAKLQVTAWDENFERVRTRLNLPPGNALFAAFGADKVSSSWLSNWSIWSSFVVLFSVVFATRVIGPWCGALSAVLLIGIYQEPGSPVSLIVNLLIAIGIVKYQPFSKLLPLVKTYFTFSLLAVVAALLYFSATQIRTVIYPQLETRGYNVQHYDDQERQARELVGMQMAEKEAQSKQSRRAMSSAPENDQEMIMVTKARYRQADSFSERYQSDALVQAGEGIPSWNWRQYTLTWNSPVSPEQTLDLWVMKRPVYGALKLVGALFALLWLLYLWRSQSNSLQSLLGWQKAAPLLLTLVLLPGYSPQGFANTTPATDLLAQLQTRLVQAPECAPHCVSINQLSLHATGNKLEMDVQVSALVDSVIALPRSEFWQGQKVWVNGDLQTYLASQHGWAYLQVPRGAHTLRIQGLIMPVDSLQLQFRTPPKFVTVKPSEDWQFNGLQGSQMLGDRLSLSSTIQKRLSASTAVTRLEYKPVVIVNRYITLDQSWRVRTLVQRISPRSGAINVNIALLEGENLNTQGFEVVDQGVLVSLSEGQSSVEWASTLDKREILDLKAGTEGDRVEHWQLLSSPSWHFTPSGLPVIIQEQNESDYFSYHFYPYPGESLQVNIARPPAVEGNVIAIDKLRAELKQGERSTTLDLQFNYRSTRGGEHTIDLPSDFELKKIQSDGQLLNIQMQKQSLVIPVLPGAHSVQLSMRYTGEDSNVLHMPRLNLHAPVSNIDSTISLNNDRWVLWTQGPVLGPAVIYWGELLVFILIALLLAKVNFSPLKTWQWLLLGFGLSLNNWYTLILIVTWFAALSATRFRGEVKSTAMFNLSQLGLYFLSGVTLLSIISTIPDSLLSNPDMGIKGNNSYGNVLHWFADRSAGNLPDISVLSVSNLIYKGLMLLWVMWLSFSLLSWIKWAWKHIGAQGYWRSNGDANVKTRQNKPETKANDT